MGYKNQQNESRIVLQAKYLDTLKKKKKPKKLYTTKYLTWWGCVKWVENLCENVCDIFDDFYFVLTKNSNLWGKYNFFF